jgi:hypothetical protein
VIIQGSLSLRIGEVEEYPIAQDGKNFPIFSQTWGENRRQRILWDGKTTTAIILRKIACGKLVLAKGRIGEDLD